MSQSPPQAQVIGSSESTRHLRNLMIGFVLLAVAAVAGAISAGWIPNFVAGIGLTNEVLLYVAELTGFYALVFLLVGLLGAPPGPRDYFGGAALMALGIFAYTAAHDLPGMRGFAFGPGTAPRMFAAALGALGLAVSVTGLFTKGPGIDRFYLRGPAFITLSVLLFAWMVRPLGLVIASFLSICAAAGATPEARVLETVIWGAVLTAFCCFLFPYALNLPMQLWPNSWDPASIIKGLSTFR
jgi:putative tricarboxylic transport membrane protein